MPKKLAIAGVLILLLSCSVATIKQSRHPAATPAEVNDWTLSGFLPGVAGKVYLNISGRKITAISPTAPATQAGRLFVDTNDLIFPGLIDMHSHIKYNVLPLWDQAKGQFLNRFEWREKFPPYTAAVSGSMANISGNTTCSAVRWAEVKAITGGVTAIQGIGGDTECAKGFGIHSLEIPGEFGTNLKIRGITDMIMPGLLGAVYLPMILPYLKAHPGSTYEQAYGNMLDQEHVSGFVKFISTQPHTLSNGLMLLIGNDFGVGSDSSPAAFTAILPKLTAALMAAPYSMNANAAAKQIAEMQIWLFGKTGEGKSSAFITAGSGPSQAYGFLTKGGVLTVSSAVRRYIGMFEQPVRESAISFYPGPVVAHLSEGMRNDAYNIQEWGFARDLGLTKKGLIVIHGVGMGPAEFQEAAENEVSIVWSPFSNLLLYGETLDVEAARAAGVNIALGADWSPTGSKNLLDELKIARRYLNHSGVNSVSDKDLVNMATANAATALGLSGVAGCVAVGCQADLMLIEQPNGQQDPYTALVQATQQQVDLVVVAGQPIYGDPVKINEIAKEWDGGKQPEILPLPGASQNCGFQKAIRLSSMDSTYETSVAGMQADLKGHMSFTPDPIFNCENHVHSSDATMNYPQRFATFIETELAKNAANRTQNRSFEKTPNWSPLSAGASSDALNAPMEKVGF